MRKEFLPYPKEIIRHFKHPKGLGRIKNPSAIGKAGNILCGDVLWCYIRVGKNKRGEEIIKDVRMEVFGCIVAIGISSLLTKMVKGKTIDKILELTKDDILKRAGKIPPLKVHCSVLAADALHEAIYDYYTRNGLPVPEYLKKEHERIKKTLKRVEEMFKKYVDLQKETMKKA